MKEEKRWWVGVRERGQQSTYDWCAIERDYFVAGQTIWHFLQDRYVPLPWGQLLSRSNISTALILCSRNHFT